MRTIRIDDEVWDALKKRATPFEDTPNAVLRRVLKLHGEGRGKARQRAVGLTPQQAYRRPILEALVEMGGGGQVTEVLKRVREKMRSTLKPIDYRKMRSGQVRWCNAAQWERNTMRDEGLLKSDSPRGHWEITERGREYLKRPIPTPVRAKT